LNYGRTYKTSIHKTSIYETPIYETSNHKTSTTVDRTSTLQNVDCNKKPPAVKRRTIFRRIEPDIVQINPSIKSGFVRLFLVQSYSISSHQLHTGIPPFFFSHKTLKSLTIYWLEVVFPRPDLWPEYQVLQCINQCCGAGPFLCGSGSGSSLSKTSAPAPTIFSIYFRKKSKNFMVSKKFHAF
jgi:hypothetical protein